VRRLEGRGYKNWETENHYIAVRLKYGLWTGSSTRSCISKCANMEIMERRLVM